MNWIILIVAGLCECSFTFCLGKAKTASGDAHMLWIVGFVLFTVASMGLLMHASRSLPLSIAYPVWTGIGAVGTVLLSTLVLKEPLSMGQLFFTLMINGIRPTPIPSLQREVKMGLDPPLSPPYKGRGNENL